MSITGFMERGTKMLDAQGRVINLDTTRRERRLIQEGKLSTVDVLCADGLHRRMKLDSLTEYVEPEITETN